MDVACHTKKLNTTLHSLQMTDALHFVCYCNGHKTSQNHMIFSHITVLATTDLYQINLLSTFKQHYITLSCVSLSNAKLTNNPKYVLFPINHHVYIYIYIHNGAKFRWIAGTILLLVVVTLCVSVIQIWM